jgi:AraC-like DNA-binding protein
MSSAATFLHPVVISQVMLNLAARYGVDSETCLLATGINENDLRDADALITREQEMRLVENIMLALPDVPALGFELGLQYNVSTFGIWGFALRSSRTLREAMQRAVRYLPLSTAYCRFSVIDDAEGFGWLVDPEPVPRHLRQFLLERDTATGINLLRELSLAGVSIEALEYSCPKPDYAPQITALAGISPLYGQPRNALILSAADAERRLPMYDANLVRLLDEQCKSQLKLRQTEGVTGQVRALLLGPLGLAASLEDMAHQLAMSHRSLRRKLEDEHTTFRGVVEEERKMLAERLLQSTSMKLDEMALQLGYADTASFTRAFRRWMGLSPGEYRSQHRG